MTENPYQPQPSDQPPFGEPPVHQPPVYGTPYPAPAPQQPQYPAPGPGAPSQQPQYPSQQPQYPSQPGGPYQQQYPPPQYQHPGAPYPGQQPGQPYPGQPYPGVPYPASPPYGQPYPGYYEDPAAKSRLAAGLLGIFLGSFGVHRFYLGHTGIGVLMLVLSAIVSPAVFLLTFGLLWFVPLGMTLWGFIEGILYLAARQGTYSVDATGRPLRS